MSVRVRPPAPAYALRSLGNKRSVINSRGAVYPERLEGAGKPPNPPTLFVGSKESSSMNNDCIFCKIINKTIPTTIIKENDDILVVQDIAPKAPIHYLIIPKKHITNIIALTDADQDICWKIMDMARDLGNDLPSKAFNLISNNGQAAGQSVFHLHFHFLAGKNLYTNGLKL